MSAADRSITAERPGDAGLWTNGEGPRLAHLEHAISAAPRIPLPKSDGSTYAFDVLAFGEMGTFLPSDLIREVAGALAASIRRHFPAVEEIVSPEPGGHTWGMVTSYLLDRPMRILRSKDTNGAQRVATRTAAYYEGSLHYSPPSPGTKIVLCDDVVSSGGTARSMVDTLRADGAEVLGVQVIYAKQPVRDLARRLDIELAALAEAG